MAGGSLAERSEAHQYSAAGAQLQTLGKTRGTGDRLLGPRRDLDPRLVAHLRARVIRFGALAVVPVGLWRSRWLDVHGWLLHDDRWRSVAVVGRRVIPPRVPPE